MGVNVIVADCPALGAVRAQKTWPARLSGIRRMRKSTLALVFRCTILQVLALSVEPCRWGALRYNRALRRWRRQQVRRDLLIHYL